MPKLGFSSKLGMQFNIRDSSLGLNTRLKIKHQLLRPGSFLVSRKPTLRLNTILEIEYQLFHTSSSSMTSKINTGIEF